jgi:hypothetical protein
MAPNKTGDRLSPGWPCGRELARSPMTCGSTTILADHEEGSAGHSIIDVERSIADWECRGRFRHESMFRLHFLDCEQHQLARAKRKLVWI